MDTYGRHLLVEYRGCSEARLDDDQAIEELMKRAAVASGANIVQTVFHRFSPQGVTGVVVVEESHLSIHTWPEYGYAAVDFYTCGDCVPERARDILYEGLRATSVETLKVDRGLSDGGRSIAPHSHILRTRTDQTRTLHSAVAASDAE